MLPTRGDGWLVAFTSCLVFPIWDPVKNKIPWRYYNYTHIGYLSGGSAYLPYFETLGLKPDYIAVKRDVREIPGYEPVRTYRGRKRVLQLWKRKDTDVRR